VVARPTGTVTLLFSDVEASTRLLERLGTERYAEVLEVHRRLVRDAFARHKGYEVGTEGDSFFVSFARAEDAVAAAREAQQSLADARWPNDAAIRVRMGLHTGEPAVTSDRYVGMDVHRAARIMAAAHGGQVLLSGATRQLVAEDVLDLGKHRLKDFEEPVALFQLGVGRFPPLRTISNTNLPVPLSSFVGREREVDEVVSLVRDEGVRLLTLVGPGGTGKTRLALEAAEVLVGEFPGGVFWVALAPVRDAALVADTIAQTLETKQEAAAHIGDKELLLVLDNLEQVIEVAVELAALLRACPNLRLLITSREALRVGGEVVYPVPALLDAEATDLFCTRARVEADETVATLCNRLDNLPLALELAAARISLLSPAQILERISQRLDLFQGGRDADPRQQTLRATIAWSYELLTADEKRLFSRLAVFRGGCSLETAEQIADAELDTLQALVDKSLLRRSQERFWMLETIREYAGEQLAERGEAEQLHDSHATYYLRLSERAHNERYECGVSWARRLEVEHDNLRAALDHLQDHEPLRNLQLAAALGWFWHARSHYAEGLRRLEPALAIRCEPGLDLARALAAVGMIDQHRGLHAASLSRLEQAHEIFRRIGDETESTMVENEMGWSLFNAGEPERAHQLFKDNLEHARRLDHPALVNRAMAGTCRVLVAMGDFDRAEPLALELHTRSEDSQDIICMSTADAVLADCAMDQEDFVGAERHRLAALENALTSGDVWQQTSEVLGLACTTAALGHHDDALRLEGAADRKWRELGVSHSFAFVETWRERDIGQARAALGPERAEAAFAEGQAMTWDQAIELALVRQHAPKELRI
jgi:predicted ATPase/class 3 adenylate cyclase